MGSYVKVIFLSVLILNRTIAQNIEWANKLVYKSIEYQSTLNYPESVLGPPSIYGNFDYESDLFDLYADGYILYPDRERNEIIELGYIKPMPANQVIIGGILNSGVIKRVSIILKDKKLKQVYEAGVTTDKLKYYTHYIKFNLETVYGVRLVIDHTKINKWNIVKGVGILKGEEKPHIKPHLYTEGEFPFPKDTIGHNINTHECFEFNPRLSFDGSKIYFVKECPGQTDQDIWFSEGDAAGKWKNAINIGKPLNNSGHNFIASISMDGNTLYIGNTYKSNGEQLGSGISISHWQQNKTWSIPVNVELPNFSNIHEYANYYMSHDQTVLLIAMEDVHSQGDLDLYVSLYNKNKKAWSEPFNMGEAINTSFGEDYPYISHDESTLYFSSKGHMGYGGHDIFMSKRLDNSWQKWSIPVNLGPMVNTKTDDDGFMISNSGDYAYFNTVAFDSIHNMDIYKIKLPKILYQKPQVLIKGKTLSSGNGLPVKTNIRFKEKGRKNYESTIINNDDDGNFSFILPHGKEYEIIVEGSNFFKITDQISLLDSNQKSKVLKNYKLDPYLDSGQVLVMNNILFEYGTEKLSDTSFSELDKLVKKLSEQKKSVIEVSGHTDEVGSEEFNLKLSEARATSVVEYFITKGIRSWRMKAKGYGESAPIAYNNTEEGRMLNRRVEILILEEDFTNKYKKKIPDKIRKGRR